MFSKSASSSSSSENYSGRSTSNKTWKQLGDTSRKYESGRGGPGTINSQKATQLDAGGASYGLYQFSAKQGTVQQYQKSTKYKELKSLKPGTAQFDQAWKAVAKRDPNGFAAEQHEFVKTNYYDRANKRLKKNGLDFSTAGPGCKT